MLHLVHLCCRFWRNILIIVQQCHHVSKRVFSVTWIACAMFSVKVNYLMLFFFLNRQKGPKVPLHYTVMKCDRYQLFLNVLGVI